MFCVEGITK